MSGSTWGFVGTKNIARIAPLRQRKERNRKQGKIFLAALCDNAADVTCGTGTSTLSPASKAPKS